MSFHVGRHKLGFDPCYIIAEAGSNHDGNMDRALKMIDLAADAGADAVKFQLFKADKIAARINVPESRLTGSFSKFGADIYDLYKGAELPVSWVKELKSYCDGTGIHFLATPFDEDSADLLAESGVEAIKIASFEITHLPLLRHVGALGLPVLLSTGLADEKEIREAVDSIGNGGETRVALFHCGIEYPLPFNAVDLRYMQMLSEVFNCPVGYSDHTSGSTVPVAATALGAVMLEKHVTLPGGRSPDHSFAMAMSAFKAMVSEVRHCEQAMGRKKKRIHEVERRHLIRGRRSVFLVGDVKAGELFTAHNLAVLRPGTGLPPVYYDEIMGKTAVRDMKAIRMIEEGDWC